MTDILQKKNIRFSLKYLPKTESEYIGGIKSHVKTKKDKCSHKKKALKVVQSTKRAK